MLQAAHWAQRATLHTWAAVKNNGRFIVGSGTDNGFGNLEVWGTNGMVQIWDATHFCNFSTNAGGDGIISSTSKLYGFGLASAAAELNFGTNLSHADWGAGGIKLVGITNLLTNTSTAASGTVNNMAVNFLPGDSLITSNSSVVYNDPATLSIAPPVLTIANGQADVINRSRSLNLLGSLRLPGSTTAVAPFTMATGTAPTSPQQGDLYATTGHLFYRDQSTTYDLLSSAATPTLQQVFTAGTTLTGNNTIINGTNTTAWSGAGDNMFGSSTVNATALFQIQTTAQPQLALHNDATHFTTFNDQSGGGITITPSNASSGVNKAGNLVIAGTNQSHSINGDHTGTITLVSGTKTFTVTNSATSSELLITEQTPTGVTTTVGYSASCTSGSCTVTLTYTAGGTTNTGDTSILRYVLIN